ncbi:MAG TPA: sugar phosphate nucleotidyltransferase, partial [Nitrososphaeraceae archaeon]|nr:sugar phosphate nucleotidyltransferase [Nitrososphaeraceae archaeon]
ALKNAQSLLGGTESEGFFMVNGDILTDLDPNMLRDGTTLSAIAVVPLRSPYGVIELDESSNITGFVEKPQIEDRWINAGVYYFETEVFRYLPDSGNIEMTALPMMIKDRKVKAIKYEKAFWRSIDSHKDIEEASREIKNSRLLS